MKYQIPQQLLDEYQISFGLEEKKKILGLNAARLYGIDVADQKQRIEKAEKTGKSASRKTELVGADSGRG
jgi:hypothetical protein